jgi:4-hydroxy-tetrahydrodipicolinate synthase
VREVAGIAGIAEGNAAQLAQTVRSVGSRVAVYCTRDSYILESMAAGASGAVSFASNVAAPKVVRLWNEIAGGDAAAAEHQNEITTIVNALLERNLTSSLKAAMNEAGLRGGHVRPPLSDLSPNKVLS